MKKIILTLVCIVTIQSIFAQKMMTRTGEIKFEASIPAFEEIAATNSTVSCIFDKNTGDFVSLALVNAFKFKVPLMEEHFNENYMETPKFPKSSFKGKVIGFDESKLSSGKATFDLEGELTIHGVTNKINTKITFTKAGEKLIATSNFFLKPKDYKIQIPNLVKDKIAENVSVKIKFDLINK